MSNPASTRYSSVKSLGKGVKLVASKANSSKHFAQKEIEMKGKVSNTEEENLFRQSVEDEIAVLKKMSHTNITGYVDNYEENGTFYIVMEAADGGDLFDALEERRKTMNFWKESEICHLFVQICFALQHMHKCGHIHRDIKPQNIFLTIKGIVKVGDLGAHTYVGELNEAQGFVGTPAYIAPELYQMKVHSYPCDVWSLGVVLYEMLALDLPFPQHEFYLLKDDIIAKEPNYTLLEGRYSKELVDLVKSMLKKNPSDRPTMDQILSSRVLKSHRNLMVSYTCMPKQTNLLPYKPLGLCEWICGWWSRARKAEWAYATLKISASKRNFIEKQAAKYRASSTPWMDVYRAYRERKLEVLYETISLTQSDEADSAGPERELPDNPAKIAAAHEVVVSIDKRLADIEDALNVLVRRFQHKKWSVFVH